MADEKIVKMLKAIADSNRIAILEMIGSGELCACKLLENLKISQPTLSHHMRILTGCGLVNGRKEAQWIHYSIDKQHLALLKEYFADPFSANPIISIS